MDERELVEHAGFLQNLARRLLADEHLARDAVQDADVAALEGIAGGDADARIALPVGADIRGTVRVPAGVYVSGRTVLAVQTEDGSIVPRGEIAATTPTERDGRFVSSRSPAGLYEIRVLNNDNEPRVVARSKGIRPGTSGVVLTADS